MSSHIYTFVFIATIFNLTIYAGFFIYIHTYTNIPHCLCFIYAYFLSFTPGTFCIDQLIEVYRLENCKIIQQF